MSRVKSGMRISADLSGVAKMLGAGKAMTQSVEDKQYQELIINAAYNGINETFNSEAAAYAAAGGSIKHMFEWGTIGINRKRSNKRPLPTSENARLWTNHMAGIGLNQTLNYTFKPSIAYVPKPTKRDTGMSIETISALRDHVFTWKAMVMETGANVTVKPVNAKMLLMPIYNDDGSASPRDRERGYRLGMGPYTFAPGKKVAGNFSTFWAAFWEGRAQGMFEQSIEQQVESDFTTEIMWNKRSNIKPSIPGSFTKQVQAEEKRVRALALARAKARAGGNE